MAFEPFVWYCRPVAGGVWTNAMENAFGAYTPCAIDSLVVVISHLVVLSLCVYRIWLINKYFKVQKFCLKSKIYNYVLCLLAASCAFGPSLKLIMGISVFNLDGQAALAPFELGYGRPLTEKDIWKLDTWDQTETLYNNFQKSWVEESQKSNPWLLRALNSSLGGRFWLGGLWKIGNDISQFVGPVILNKLLESMQRGDPSGIGYMYAFSMLTGMLLGVLCNAQYFQNVMRVGLRLRSTMVASVSCKFLRLTHEARKKFATGKITNLITTDAATLQEITQSLHTLWSAPFHITIAMILLYQQLGVSSLFGTLLLLLLFPIQTLVISKSQKQSKEGLQRTDKRVGLMNEILAAMDTVKCYAWERSFQSKVQSIRNDELSWFRKASLLGALNSFILNSIPVLVTVTAFGLFTAFGGDLTPSRAFTSLSLFAVLRFPLLMLPNIVTQVSESGENFSIGQRQLLSLARTLLRRAKILVLDEATAAVDVRTDALIQKTIREEFKSCTMLIIAHRLNTIVDCDRTLLLEACWVLEYNTPKELLSNEESTFSKMVQSTGAANAQYLHSLVLEGEAEKRLD